MALHSAWRDCQAWRDLGLPFTSPSNEACKLYDVTLTQYVGWFDEPSLGGMEVTLTKMLEADPQNVMGHVLNNGLELMATAKIPGQDPELKKSLDLMNTVADSTERAPSDWERSHVKAINLCSKGYMAEACGVWEDILVQYPLDMLAIKLSTDSYFYLGYLPQMRDSIARVLPRWKEDTPLYGYLLGMYSFGLEETNFYQKAESTARKGLAINPRDAWSTHSLAHVLEMGGRFDEGIAFMSTTVKDWSYCGYLACHNFWHWALYHIEKGEHQGALDIFDSEINKRTCSSGAMFDIVDASSILFRLEMEGVDVGDRWRDVSEACRPHADDHILAFNDVHLLMSLLGDKKRETADQMMDSIKTFVKNGSGTNHGVTRDVGAAVCEAFVAYDNNDFAKAVDLLYPVRYQVVRIGGSNAQRDIFNQFLIHAAMTSPEKHHKTLARSLLSERKQLKECSPLTDRLIAKAMSRHDM